MSSGPGPHRISRGKRVFPLAKILVGAREDDFDFSDPATDDFGEAHEAGTLDERG